MKTGRPKLPPQEGRTCKICGDYKDKTHYHVTKGRLHPYCKPCQLAGNRARRGPAQNRRYHLKEKYNITPEEHDALVQSQQGRCVICLKPCHDWGLSADSFVVDHDHKTREVRALLCANCNRGLGMFQDCPESLRRAANYIEQAA